MTLRTGITLVIGTPLIIGLGALFTYWGLRRYDTPTIIRELPHPSATVSPERASRISIASFNLYFSPADRTRRLEMAAQALARLAPDILFLQEVATGGIHRDDPIAYLGERLGLPYTTYFPVENLLLFKQGLAILSRFPIESSQARVFERNKIIETKGYLAASIRTPQGLLHAIDVHLMNASGANFGKNTQFESLNSAIQEHRKTGPVLVAGDFNAEPGDPELDRFFARSNARSLYDAFPLQGEMRFSWNNEALLDYVLLFDRLDSTALNGYRFLSGDIVKIPQTNDLSASDHAPVHAILGGPRD